MIYSIYNQTRRTYRILITLIAILINSQINAQTNPEDITNEKERIELSKHNIYTDLNFATFGQITLNYERKLIKKNKTILYGRLGAGYGGNLKGNSGYGGIGGLTILTGKNNHHFETNFGIFIGDNIKREYPERLNKRKAFFMPIIDAGYRYQKPGGGLILKAKIVFVGVGVGVGYAF